MALIKHFAGLVETNAGTLANNSGGNASANANNVITNFEVVDKAFNQLSDKSNLKSEYYSVKQIYDRILNLTKLKYYAEKLQLAATGLGALRDAASALASNVTNLRDNTGTDAQQVKSQFETVQNKFDELTEDEETKVKNEFWALKTVYDSILNLSKTTTLKTEAGASSSEGLRALASTLYTNANNLYDAVIDVKNDANAAKVLQAKAGTSQSSPGKLRKLAADLYEKANALAEEVRKAGGGVSDEQAAQNLKEAVGETEGTTGTSLRKALKVLGNASGDDLSVAAGAVTSQYGTVKGKFGEVQQKNTEGAYNSYKVQYQAVEKAWNDFNAVYNPEEQLVTAADELKQALNQLGGATILSPDVHNKAEEVKNKFEGFGAVKSKFELVKKQ